MDGLHSHEVVQAWLRSRAESVDPEAVESEAVSPIQEPEVSPSHKCDYDTCNEGFSRLHDLRKHMLTHSNGEKPYLCSHQGCGDRFFFKSSLTLHMKFHPRWIEDASPPNMRAEEPLDMRTDLSRRDLEQNVAAPFWASNHTIGMSALADPGTVPPLEESVQQPTLDWLPSTSGLPTPRSRSNSPGSIGSRRSRGTTGTGGTGNSDEKSEGGDQLDWLETSRIPKHWKTGASILRRLERILLSAHRGHLSVALGKAIGRLALATTMMKLNAKAWLTISKTLHRHYRDLKSSSTYHKISIAIQEYIMVLKVILALWIRTVDPLIHLPYDELPLHQKPGQFSSHRSNLFLLAEQHAVELIDEDAIYEWEARLEEAFKAILDSEGKSLPALTFLENSPPRKEYPRKANTPTVIKSAHTASSLELESPISRKRMRGDSEGDHEADSLKTRRRKTTNDATADVIVAADKGVKDAEVKVIHSNYLLAGFSPLHLLNWGRRVEPSTSTTIPSTEWDPKGAEE